MEIGLVHKIDIDHEMQQAYLDYAMSVIVARALPDARDGLKPVHRRILYAMYDMGLRPDSPYKKSARIVGEVLGKYHPHGDAAVYETMARMAQDFSMRYLLVNGQGNFGSVDGDPPAAMRYTEARLATPAMHLLADIQKNTVDFNGNFDDTLSEPSVLPAALPNLLVNGATGIAVGMATSIPPHNLGEIVAASHAMLENWDNLDEIGVEELMQHVNGPDFPTGGVLVHSAGEDGLVSAYSTGRGRVTIQARARLEEMERGRSRIIVTELPYMTNKSSLIERIAELAREEKLEGIADLRDESDRQGMRIVIELNKSADPEVILRNLYKYTPMQQTFSINMLALVDGEPRTLSLKQALRVYLEHRLEIIRRRSQHDLEKARARAHILEGLRIALKNLDEIIDMIRKAPDADTARTRLIKRFKLTEIQAQAILDMQLRRLAALERKKIEDEYKELQATIKELEALLRSPKKMRGVVGDELDAVEAAYGDRRRTLILQVQEGQSRTMMLSAADMVPEKEVWVSVTPQGLISRSIEDRMPALDNPQVPTWLVKASVRDTLYLVGETGEAAAMPVHALPENADPTQGAPFDRVSALKDGRKLAVVFTVPPRSQRPGNDGEDTYVVTVTRQGMVKKSSWNELPGPSANLFTLVKVNEGDRLVWLGLSSGQNELLLATTGGMAIRFSEDEVRPMGLAAAGVLGIKLSNGDRVAGAELLPRPGQAFLITATGKAKRVDLDQFPRQGRYGAGVQAWKLNAGEQVAGLVVGQPEALLVLHLDPLGPKSVHMKEAPLQSRTGSGKALVDQKSGARLGRLTRPWLAPHVSQTLESASAPAAPKAAPAEAKSDGKPAKAAAKAAAKTNGKAASRTDGKTDGKGASSGDGKTARPAAPAKPASKNAPTATKGEPPTAGKTTRKTAPKAQPDDAGAKPAPKTTARKASVSEPPPAPASGKKPASKTAAKSEPAAPASTTGKVSTKAAAKSEPAAPATGTRNAAPKASAKSEADKPAAAAKKAAPKAQAGTQAAPKTSTAKSKPAAEDSAAKQPAAKKPAGKAASPEAPKKPSTKKTGSGSSGQSSSSGGK